MQVRRIFDFRLHFIFIFLSFCFANCPTDEYLDTQNECRSCTSLTSETPYYCKKYGEDALGAPLYKLERCSPPNYRPGASPYACKPCKMDHPDLRAHPFVSTCKYCKAGYFSDTYGMCLRCRQLRVTSRYDEACVPQWDSHIGALYSVKGYCPRAGFWRTLEGFCEPCDVSPLSDIHPDTNVCGFCEPGFYRAPLGSALRSGSCLRCSSIGENYPYSGRYYCRSRLGRVNGADRPYNQLAVCPPDHYMPLWEGKPSRFKCLPCTLAFPDERVNSASECRYCGRASWLDRGTGECVPCSDAPPGHVCAVRHDTQAGLDLAVLAPCGAGYYAYDDFTCAKCPALMSCAGAGAAPAGLGAVGAGAVAAAVFLIVSAAAIAAFLVYKRQSRNPLLVKLIS